MSKPRLVHGIGLSSYDRAAALSALGNAEDLLGDLIELFLESFEGSFAALRSAVESKDAEAVESSAHHLKGSALQLSASRVARLCAALEERGSAGDLTESEALLRELEAELADLVTELHQARPS